MQKSDYLRQKKLNPADELRELLTKLEQRQFKLQAMTSTQALILLRELDQLDTLFEELEATGLSLLPEQGRFKSLESRLRQNAAPLLRALGGPEALAEHRPEHAPVDRWWWTIDELVAARRKRTLKRIALGVSILALLLGGLIIAFNTILAPSPEVKLAFDLEQKISAAIKAQDYRGALVVVDEGLLQLPHNPHFWLYKGVLHQLLTETVAAEQAFAQAQAQFNDPLKFYLRRSELQLRLNQPQQAEEDARAAIALDERSAQAWLLLGQALQWQERAVEAIPVYERAGQLAMESGDSEIVVLARLALRKLGGLSVSPQ